jgi:hypothetical protein
MPGMARNKDYEWKELPNTWSYVHVRVLQDIRDELQKLNSLLHCHRFVAIPHTLNAIRKNTTKRKTQAKKVKTPRGP